MPNTLLGLNSAELRALALEQGETAYRGSQLAHWIYRSRVHTFDEMGNLPKPFLSRLADGYQVGRSQTAVAHRSPDGTVKLLLAMDDGQKVETVGLPYADHFSCCASTQVGCPVRCAFCATGISGYSRNLTAGEIVDQVLTVQEVLRAPLAGSLHGTLPRGESGEGTAPSGTGLGVSPRIQNFPLLPSGERGQGDEGKGRGGGAITRVSHVVFMGMGEPLLNYEATLKAVRLLNSEVGIGMRHLTVSTVGFVPAIRRLAQERLQLTLAVSLHAPNDELRWRLIPTMTRWGIAEILEACRHYVSMTGRRVTFEYCLLDRVNDGVADAQQLGQALRGLNCHVNLIPYNPVPGLGFQAPPSSRVRTFRAILEDARIPVTQRVQRGADINAACGQLRRAAVTL